MIKRILLPLDNSQYADDAIELGSVIARKLDAELTGLVILDITGIERSMGLVPVGAIHYAEKIEKSIIRNTEDPINDLLARFEKNVFTARSAFEKKKPKGVLLRELFMNPFFMMLL